MRTDLELLKREAEKVAQMPPFKDYLEALEEWRGLRKVLERLNEEKENALYERFKLLSRKVKELRKQIPKPVFEAYYKIQNLEELNWELIVIESDDRRVEVGEEELKELAEKVETPQAFYLLTALRGVGVPIEVEAEEEFYNDGEDSYLEYVEKVKEVYSKLFKSFKGERL